MKRNWHRGVVAGLSLVWMAVSAAMATLPQPTSGLATEPPPNGPRRGDAAWHAFTNVTVHAKPSEVIDKATVIIRDGRILFVQRASDNRDDLKTQLQSGARVWDGSGLHLYPAFIDAYVEVDSPRAAADTPGVHWNPKVTPQRSALDGSGLSAGDAEALRKMGFGAAAISPSGGIFRGISAVVSLAKTPDEQSAARPAVYVDRVYQTVAFEIAQGGRDVSDVDRWPGYPGSQMGAIALIRQTFLDADWQVEAREAGSRLRDEQGGIPFNAIDALNYVRWGKDGAPTLATDGELIPTGGKSPGRPWLLFNADDELEALRAAKIGNEFKRKTVILGSGVEYQRLGAIKETGLAFVEPLNFPKPPDVSTITKQEQTDLREMMAWEQAPTNLRRMDAAGIKTAITTSKSGGDRGQFWANLRKAIRHGLPEDRALAMLTTTPAELLGVSDHLGTIEEGKIASFIITDGPIFDRKTKICDVWIDGRRHEINNRPAAQLEGTWEVKLDPAPPANVKIGFVIDKDNNITIRKTTTEGEGADQKTKEATAKAKGVRLEGNRLSFSFEHEPFGEPGVFVNSAIVDGDVMIADGVRSSGQRFRWTAQRQPVSAAVGNWKVTDADGELKAMDAKDGLVIAVKTGAVKLTFTDAAGKVTVINGADVRFSGTPDKPVVKFTYSLEPLGGVGQSSDTITVVGDTLEGESLLPDGTKHAYKAARLKDDDATKDDEGEDKADIAAIPEKLGVPFGPYAVEAQPEQQALIFTNATIWTSGPDGVIEKGYVVVDRGRIAMVAKGDYAGGTTGKTIDMAGKHITPGLIDCHSHTGISRGVNEGGQAVTAEVRIQDVTDPDSINWYRELAGGLTVVNNLHGSANPIGGQNCVNKIRWGVAHPDDMHFAGRDTYSDADPFDPNGGRNLVKPGIKFALGENVKQSNWGDRFTNRYPQTRMGVESIIRDRFEAAKAYAAEHKPEMARWKEHRGVRENGLVEVEHVQRLVKPGDDHSINVPPRRDLELETLAQILSGDRLIHCHSYRQDEILMLARIARDYGFKIGTYQHILEGYKVADVVRDSAIGASGFTDWWAYKVEVQDAIPQGLPIMHDVGAIVSFNSDSDELARRMNGEAAKGIKYGGLSAEESLKFVTINPAKQLMIDDRVGSIESGKDADLAIWSGSPVSSLSRCEATYIDGRRYFSLEDDAKAREQIAQERQRLIQKLLKGKSKPSEASDGPGREGGPGEGGRGRRGRPPQEDDLDAINRAGNPITMPPGDCGVPEQK